LANSRIISLESIVPRHRQLFFRGVLYSRGGKSPHHELGFLPPHTRVVSRASHRGGPFPCHLISALNKINHLFFSFLQPLFLRMSIDQARNPFPTWNQDLPPLYGFSISWFSIFPSADQTNFVSPPFFDRPSSRVG